jgi:hypothetical protein
MALESLIAELKNFAAAPVRDKLSYEAGFRDAARYILDALEEDESEGILGVFERAEDE